jgi:hypothetical protein
MSLIRTFVATSLLGLCIAPAYSQNILYQHNYNGVLAADVIETLFTRD